MQAAKNWRDEFEERDTSGAEVVYVNYLPGNTFEYAYLRPGDRRMFLATASPSYMRLVPKSQTKTIRPYRRGEVKCGDVFRSRTGCEAAVALVTDKDVTLSLPCVSYCMLLANWTRLDGTPAGVEE